MNKNILGVLILLVASGILIYILGLSTNPESSKAQEPGLPSTTIKTAPPKKQDTITRTNTPPTLGKDIEHKIQILQDNIARETHALENLTAQEIAKLIPTALKNADDIRLNVAKGLLADRLRQGQVDTLNALKALVKKGPPEASRYGLIILNESGTATSLEALLVFGESDFLDKNTHARLMGQISNYGKHKDSYGQHQDKLAFVLANHLKKSPQHSNLFYAIAEGLASVGTNKGIGQLVGLLDTEKPGSEQAKRLEKALFKVDNPAAIPSLYEFISKDPRLDNEATAKVASTMANMDTTEATKALVQWATQAEGEKAQKGVIVWLRSNVVDESSLEALYTYHRDATFQDPAIEAAVGTLVEELKL